MARTTKRSRPKPPITPPMIRPSFLGLLVVSKDGLEVPLIEIPPIALEVSDGEAVGIKIVESLVCTENELLAIEDWESEPVDDASGVSEDGLGDDPEDELLAIGDWENKPVDNAAEVLEDRLGDDALFCTRRTERVKGVVAEFPW